MILLLSIFLNNIAPIFLAAGAGFAVGRTLKPDVKAISRVTFYIFSPCLVFTSLTENQLTGGEFGRLTAFTVGAIVLSGIVAYAFGRVLKLDRQTMAALLVVNMFVNGGNYGLPLNRFAFGDSAVARAVVYYVFSTLMVYTVGIVVASGGRSSLRTSLMGMFTVPAVYGLLLAGVLRLAGVDVSDPASPIFPLIRAIKLLSGAALPVMIIVLGLQLAEAKRPENLRLVTAASAMRLVTGPIIGLALAALLGLSGVARQAAVIESAMPTAVITTILAIEYGIDPIFVTSVVVVSTLLSPLTLTPLIAYLQP